MWKACVDSVCLSGVTQMVHDQINVTRDNSWAPRFFKQITLRLKWDSGAVTSNKKFISHFCLNNRVDLNPFWSDLTLRKASLLKNFGSLTTKEAWFFLWGTTKTGKCCKEGWVANRRPSKGHRFETWSQQRLFTVEPGLKYTLPLVICTHNINLCGLQ